MAEAERAFAKRALEVGWKQAFLEYFSDSAIGYDGEQVGLAKEQIRANPDPPKDHQLLWEPRYGDVARSGELGYLTGPSRNILPSRNNGQPRHGVYASVWKRERDGTFRVVMDVGTTTPRARDVRRGLHPRPERQPVRRRSRRSHAAAGHGRQRAEQRPARPAPAQAYRGRLAPGVRFHRPQAMPVVGEAGRAALSGHAAALRAGRFALRRERAVGRSRLHLGHVEPSPAAGRGRAEAQHPPPRASRPLRQGAGKRDSRPASTCGSGCASAPASGRWCSTC